MDKQQHDVVVAGGGIAGLSAAYYTLKKARTEGLPIKLTLVDPGQAWGGKIVTDRVDGFVIEGGPDTFLATKPWGVGLSRELGLGDRLHGTNPEKRNTYILHQNRLKPLPEGLMRMIPTEFGPMIRTGLLNWFEKARMGMDFVLPPRQVTHDESLGAFVSRRLGRAAYERLIEPLMSGIYAGDGDKLSLEATFPYLREMEHENGGLIKGALAYRLKMTRARKAASQAQNNNGASGGQTRANGKSGSRSIFLTPTTGLAEITEALVARLEAWGADLRLSQTVEKVIREEQGYRVHLSNGDILLAQGVILAAPAYASGDILSELDPELSGFLHQIEYASTATVTLAYREADLPRPLDGYGYVIPRAEGRRALACTWTSTKFPHRAPEGHALIRVFVGRAGQEGDIPWDDAGLLDLAKEELRLTLDITTEPLLTRVYRWDRAMPQYNVGHPARLESIDQAIERWPGLELAGNGYRGIGIPDCIYSGEVAANKIFETITAYSEGEIIHR